MNAEEIHAKIEEWIAAESAGGLSEEERFALANHVTACEECRKVYQESQLVSEAVETTLAADRPGEDFEDRMVAAFRKGAGAGTVQTARPGPTFHRRVFRIASVAAVVLLAVGLGFVFMLQFKGAKLEQPTGFSGKPGDHGYGFTSEDPSAETEYAVARPDRSVTMGLPGELPDEGNRARVKFVDALETGGEVLADKESERLRAKVKRAGEKRKHSKGLPASPAVAGKEVRGLAEEVERAKKVQSGLLMKMKSETKAKGRHNRQKPQGGLRYFGRGELDDDSRGGAAGVGSESYKDVEDNPFHTVKAEPLSTFSIDVDTASYANVRRHLNEGRFPPRGAVRIEEMVNYFKYDYPPPAGDDPFAVHLEVAKCPWDLNHRLVRIGIKGRVIPKDKRPPSNLVFLIDVSGSMRSHRKLPLLKKSMKMLVKRLTEDDHVAIVTYSNTHHLVLPSTPCDKKGEILQAIEGLRAGGSTNAGAGIYLAYEQAAKHFVKDGVNRVLLATDGDFNVGITNLESLVQLIRDKSAGGVFLTILGFGTGNLKDATLEAMADKGNGNYSYIDGEKEAKKVLVDQMSGTLITIAKDVKIQIEFNPKRVGAYRLIGYENRVMANADFRNDKKDAGEIGAGHTVTAFYEVVPAGQDGAEVVVNDAAGLKYQEKTARLKAAAMDGELLTVFLRYKNPTEDEGREKEVSVLDSTDTFSRASGDFRFAAVVAAFGMLLRNSPYKGSATYQGVQELAGEWKSMDASGPRAEFVDLVAKARALDGRGR
ncbi:MAG: YfbK domain-containing protein [Planctomycetota bacterium]|jgi:Ca-activated chloride channel family protein